MLKLAPKLAVLSLQNSSSSKALLTRFERFLSVSSAKDCFEYVFDGQPKVTKSPIIQKRVDGRIDQKEGDS